MLKRYEISRVQDSVVPGDRETEFVGLNVIPFAVDIDPTKAAEDVETAVAPGHGGGSDPAVGEGPDASGIDVVQDGGNQVPGFRNEVVSLDHRQLLLSGLVNGPGQRRHPNRKESSLLPLLVNDRVALEVGSDEDALVAIPELSQAEAGGHDGEELVILPPSDMRLFHHTHSFYLKH
jgi:hypothetical protein